MKSQTVKLPAFLASALVNGDTSGLPCSCGATGAQVWPSPLGATHEGDCDFRWLAAAIAYCAPGHIVSAGGEPYITRTCDLPGFPLAADVMEYTVLYPEGT